MERQSEIQHVRRFVILRHEGSAEYKPGVHWDLMFEYGQSLRTWALAEPLSPGVEIEAEQLPDHRPAYLDFEGPVSGGRGSVTRYDAGRFELIAESAEEWIATIQGQKLRGRLILRRVGGDTTRWRCVFTPIPPPTSKPPKILP